jgi:hypothetical protein
MSSNFYPKIFNHLIAQFGFALKNLPGESTIESGIPIKSRVEHNIQMIGPIAFIEVRFNPTEYWDAIAQVIAECTGQAYYSLC